MATIKDFKVGQSAYMVKMNQNSRKAPEIFTVEVKKVGRKYVTAWCKGERKYSCTDDCTDKQKEYLEDDSAYGYTTLLFADKISALNHIKEYNLRRKIRNFVNTSKFDDMRLDYLLRINEAILLYSLKALEGDSDDT